MPRTKPKTSEGFISDELAYIAPFAAFMVCLLIGGWWESLYPATYLARVVIAGVLLIAFWKHYTKVRWNFWWLGIIVGVIGIVEWIGFQLWLQKHFAFFRPSSVYDPTQHFQGNIFWAWIALRCFGAVIVVPFMEELFWRDWMWRSILAPNDFKLAKVGEWGWAPFLIVAGAFASVHGNWWLSAIPWAMMVGAMLVYTKSLGACIIAHLTSNLLLAAYVLHTHDWSFW